MHSLLKLRWKPQKKQDSCVLIESTANQVDQNGGYSGMTPKDFFNFCHEKAKRSLDYQVIVFS